MTRPQSCVVERRLALCARGRRTPTDSQRATLDDLEDWGRIIAVQAPSPVPPGPSSLKGRNAPGTLKPPRSSSRSTRSRYQRGSSGATLHALHGSSASAMQKTAERPTIRGYTERAVAFADQDRRPGFRDVEQCLHFMVSIPGNPVREAHRDDLLLHPMEHRPFTRMLPGQSRLDPMDHVPGDVEIAIGLRPSDSSSLGYPASAPPGDRRRAPS